MIASGRIWDKVVGNEETVRRLQVLLKADRIPSSLMFLGPNGIGKKMVALAFTQSLVCEENKMACGMCGACRRVLNEQSENLYLCKPTGGTHKIEQMRDLISWLSLSGTGRGRVILIDDAHLMTPQAANALLKSVEEPPTDTYFIFVAPSRERLIVTLRSRSQAVQFRPLSQNEKLQLQGGVPDAEKRDQALRLYQMLFRGEAEDCVLALREELSGREEAKENLDYWLQFTRDLWISKAGVGDPIHFEMHATPAMSELSQPTLAYLSQELLVLQSDLLRNADIQLSYENFVRQWRASGGLL